jgi:hypothetical protein
MSRVLASLPANGQAFWIARGEDKRRNLYYIASGADVGVLLGSYQGCREADEALEQIA